MIDEYFLNLVAVLCPGKQLTSYLLCTICWSSSYRNIFLAQHLGPEALESTTSEENMSFLTPTPLASKVVKSSSMSD